MSYFLLVDDTCLLQCSDFPLLKSLKPCPCLLSCPFQTLSWLKDNVSMAMQVCSLANFEGLEVARRCQHALEQEILTNRARIEVVKRVSQSTLSYFVSLKHKLLNECLFQIPPR